VPTWSFTSFPDHLVDGHARDRLSISLLFRRVDAVRPEIDRQAVNLFLNGDIFELPVMVRVVHLKDGNRPARTRHVNSLESWIDLDYVGSSRHGQKGDGLILIEIENRHELVSFTGKKSTVMFRVKRHAVVSFAPPNRILGDDFVLLGIDDRKNVVILEIHVDLACNRIVLRHSCLAVERERFDDLVFSHIDNCFRLSPFIGHVQLVKGSCVGASVWLTLRFQRLDDLHLLHVNNADGVVTGI